MRMRMQLLRNVYVAIIALQSIIHLQKLQDLYTRKTYQTYDIKEIFCHDV